MPVKNTFDVKQSGGVLGKCSQSLLNGAINIANSSYPTCCPGVYCPLALLYLRHYKNTSVKITQTIVAKKLQLALRYTFRENFGLRAYNINQRYSPGYSIKVSKACWVAVCISRQTRLISVSGEAAANPQ